MSTRRFSVDLVERADALTEFAERRTMGRVVVDVRS
jgi:hypothetical protein